MENKITIGRWEITALLINTMSLQIFLNFPRLMAEAAATAGWMLCLYAGFLALLAFAVIELLYRSFEGKDILEVAEYTGGVPLRIAAGTIILAHVLFAVSVILREFGEDMKVIAFTISPISFILFFFAAGMLIAAYFGLEAIARVHAYSVPIIIAGFLIIIFGVAPYYNFDYLFPLMGSGAYEIFVKGIPKISVFAPIIVLFNMVPFLGGQKDFRRSGYTAITVSIIFMVYTCIVYSMVFPYPAALENFLPMYQLSRLVNLGRFFQRSEPLFMVVWIAAAFMYLSTVFFIAIYVFKRTYNLKYYRPLIFPFIILVFTISLLPPNLMSAIKLETEYYRNFAGIITFGMTILILAAARIKQSLKGRDNKA